TGAALCRRPSCSPSPAIGQGPKHRDDAVEPAACGLRFLLRQVAASTRYAERHHGFPRGVDGVLEACGALAGFRPEPFAAVERDAGTGALHLVGEVAVVLSDLAGQAVNQLYHFDE